MSGSPPASPGPIWPIRLMQLQLSLLYGVNALAKTTPAYLSGQVNIKMSQMLSNFRVDLSEGPLHLGPMALPIALLSCLTVAVDYCLAIGFWFPRPRIYTAVLGVAFHIALTRVIDIGMLDWASMFLYLAFRIPFDRLGPKEASS